MTHPRSRSLARALCEAAVVVVFLLLVLVPWETWLGAKPTLARMSEGASWAHPLGFDNLGRDLLARIAAALRGAVLPLWAAVAAGAIAGTLLGALATLTSARRVVTLLDGAMAVVCSLPVGVVCFAWAAYREEAGLLAVMASLAPLAGALAYLRLRDLARRDAALAYWEAHRAAGGTQADRLLRYGVAGAWRSPLLLLLGFLLRVAVAIEAALSYLGFGVVEPQASFGNILAAHFELYLRGEWRVLAVVAAALALAAAFPAAALGVGERILKSKIISSSLAIAPKPTQAAHMARHGQPGVP